MKQSGIVDCLPSQHHWQSELEQVLHIPDFLESQVDADYILDRFFIENFTIAKPEEFPRQFIHPEHLYQLIFRLVIISKHLLEKSAFAIQSLIEIKPRIKVQQFSDISCIKKYSPLFCYLNLNLSLFTLTCWYEFQDYIPYNDLLQLN